MRLTSRSRFFVAAVGFAVLVGLVLGASGRALGAQNAPNWSTGDYWTYSVDAGSDRVTWTVQGQTTLTIGSTNHAVWHVTAATTSGNTTVTIDTWLTTSGLRVAKTSGIIPFFGTISVVNDPPEPLAVFPLAQGGTWSGTTSVTTTLGSISNTVSQSYSGTVLGESSVTVPAGTFTAARIRSPSAGDPYEINYFSESTGWLVKSESYDAFGALSETQDLVSFKYSGTLANLLLLVVGVIVILAVVATVAVVAMRRRRPPMMAPPPYPQQYPPQPPAPPPQGP